MQHLHFALRQLRKNPGFAFTAVIVLALSIGSSTAVFNTLYEAVLRPLPYADPGRLVFVHNAFPKGQVATSGVSSFDYARIRSHKDVFADAGIFYWNDLTLTGYGAARHVNVVNASASVFTTLQMKPRLGRTFSDTEDRNGAAGVTILSDALWKSAFGAARDVLGRIIHLNGAVYTVIGVMPPEFRFPSRETQLWIPVALPAGAFTIEGGRLEKWLSMVARLTPDATPDRAGATLRVIADRLGSAYPAFYPTNQGWHFTIRSLREEQSDHVRRWLYLAFGAVVCVLLIACINVGGLLLIRGAARSHEMAIRMAIGAGRRRIVLQILTETSALVLLGCAFGLAFALLAIRLVNLYGPLPETVHLRLWSILFAFAIAVASTVFVGLLPALATAGVPVAQVLKNGVTRTSTGNSGWRNAIAGSQLALAVVLMFTATQLNRSFVNLINVPAGFNPGNVWSGALDLPSRSYAADQSWNSRFFLPLLQELRALPGVESAAAANALPFNPSGVWTEGLQIPESSVRRPPPEAQIALALPRYFETLKIRVLRGRTFTPRDRTGAPLVAVIDHELALRYFPGQDALGKRIGSAGGNRLALIVGVVGSVHNDQLGAPHQPQVYFSELQERTESMYLALRMKDASNPTAAVRKVIAKLDSGVALYDVKPMDARIAESLKLRRFIAVVLSGLAVFGTLLAIVGLYASLAYLVELRRREIGIRMALGAKQVRIVRMIARRATKIVAVGLLAGVAGAFAAQQVVQNQLFGVKVTDALTWLAVLCGILIASIISTCLPAWRAASIEPTIALRHD